MAASVLLAPESQLRQMGQQWSSTSGRDGQVAAATARLLAEEADTPGQAETEREFNEALAANEAVRLRLNSPS